MFSLGHMPRRKEVIQSCLVLSDYFKLVNTSNDGSVVTFTISSNAYKIPNRAYSAMLGYLDGIRYIKLRDDSNTNTVNLIFSVDVEDIKHHGNERYYIQHI